MWCIKPTVDKIVNAGNANYQETMIHAAVDHPALAAAHTVGDIVDAFEGVEDSSWASYLCLVTMNIQNWLEKDISVGGHEAVGCNLPCMGANCGPPIPILIMGGPPG